MRIIRAKDYEAMSRRAAGIVASVVTLQRDCVLGLATGSTPVGMYRQLVQWHQAGDLDFGHVRSVNLDEYVGLDEENDQSYHYFMRENLFGHVNIQPGSTHVPNGMVGDLEAECAGYDRLIQELGGVALQVLGIGNNGHIGFNEPSSCFEKGTHVVTLDQRTIDANARFFASPQDVPRRAVTMGIGSIMKARAVLLLASGRGKSGILEQSLFGPITPQVPASILQLHPSCTVVADEEALEDILRLHPQAVE